MNYTFEELTPLHTEKLQELFDRVFGHRPEESYLHAKYGGTLSYCGKGWYGYMALQDGNPVAFTGAIPVWMTYRGKNELAVQSMDSMTDKAHGGRGLNAKLTELLIARLCEADVRFIWGLPNQLLEPVMVRKIDFLEQSRFRGYVLHEANGILDKARRKSGLLTDKKLKSLIREMQTDECFSGSLDPDETVCVLSDEPYFSYKAFSGSSVIRYKDALLWVKAGTDLLIGDVQAPDADGIRRALTDITRLAAKAGARMVLYQGIPETAVARIAAPLASRTFASWLLCYRDMGSSFPLDRLAVRYGDLDTF